MLERLLSKFWASQQETNKVSYKEGQETRQIQLKISPTSVLYRRPTSILIVTVLDYVFYTDGYH